MGAERIPRIGPDRPLTHWMLYHPRTMRWLCRRMFPFFGDEAEFRPGAYAIHTDKIWIGSRTVVRPGSMLFADPHKGIYLGNDVLLGPGVHVYVNSHLYQAAKPIYEQGYKRAAVTIQSGSWIGANSIILPGVNIGRGAVVGAGSVVTKSVPAMEIWAGNPARKIGERKREAMFQVRSGEVTERVLSRQEP